MRRLVILMLVASLVAGVVWWLHRPSHPGPVNASLFETDMVEGLVRGILPDIAANTSMCFLAFGDGTTSPSRAFIARFADSRPSVRSCGSAVSPPIGKYFETSSGKPGLIVHVIRFREIIPGTFDVWVGFSNLPPGHDQFIYRIANLAGEWKIKSRKPA